MSRYRSRTRKDGKRVKTSWCAFNLSSQAFISLGVSVADTTLARLRGLLGKMKMRSDEALWIVPSQGIHTIGLLFPIDVLYLDSDLRVVSAVEHMGPLRISPLKWRSASVLELPARSIYESGTRVGDQLIICPPADMHAYLSSRVLKSPGRKPEDGQAGTERHQPLRRKA